MAHPPGDHVLLPVLLHGPADIRLCHSRHSGGAGNLENNARLGQHGLIVGLRYWPVDQWKSWRPFWWPADDESGRVAVMRAELGGQLWLESLDLDRALDG